MPSPDRYRFACFGGIYSNYLALDAAIRDAQRRGVDAMYCLGDLGAFGPYPDRVFPLLHEASVSCVQGNYDDSISRGLADCQCGYTDPEDNRFAQISYDYTLANTSEDNRRWMGDLPKEIRFNIFGKRILLCHGSPRRTNEFLWETTTSIAFLQKLFTQHEADVILGTHSGLKWRRCLEGGKLFANVGVLGRPENDGQTNVWYAMLTVEKASHGTTTVDLEYIPIVCDHQRLAQEMLAEKLPAEFVETILTGWWTTCLEILPSKERRRGKY